MNILIENLLDKIQYNHSVFYKTDGERVNVLIYNSVICYIDNILDFYYIGNIDNDKVNILFDAELYENKFYIFN